MTWDTRRNAPVYGTRVFIYSYPKTTLAGLDDHNYIYMYLFLVFNLYIWISLNKNTKIWFQYEFGFHQIVSQYIDHLSTSFVTHRGFRPSLAVVGSLVGWFVALRSEGFSLPLRHRKKRAALGAMWNCEGSPNDLGYNSYGLHSISWFCHRFDVRFDVWLCNVI